MNKKRIKLFNYIYIQIIVYKLLCIILLAGCSPFPTGNQDADKTRLENFKEIFFTRNLNPLCKTSFFNSQYGIVYPDKNSVIQYNDVYLAIPEGAVDKEMQIKIEELTHINALNPGMMNITNGTKGYRFLPDNLEFKKNITVSIPYNKKLISRGNNADNVFTYFFNTEQNRWQKLHRIGIDYEKGYVISVTNHFTDIINSTLIVPETPKLLENNPNSIKSMKAADPSTGIHTLEVPEPNPQGNLNLTYPLETPSGRNGMHPQQLQISYNSEAGNGWCGIGWNIAVSQITVDTRWGVPYYAPNGESETYLLDGEQLAPVSFHRPWVNRSENKSFYPRIEGSFRRIIRHGNSPSEYYWEVIDKNGTKSFYGGTIEDGLIKEAILAASGDQGNIFQWALVMKKDTNGNKIHYHYRHEGDGISGYEFYLSEITYTGYNDNEGSYKIEFVTDKYAGEPVRKDVAINCRGGFKNKTSELLRFIRISYTGTPVRTYELSYETGIFSKSFLTAIIQRGSDGSEFCRTRLDYYNDLCEGGLYNGFDSSSQEIETGADNIDNDLKAYPLDNEKLSPSVLGSTNTNGESVHIYVGVKPGFSMEKDGSMGFKGGAGSSSTEGTASFIDLNGDNLPDKVFREGGHFYFKPQFKDGSFGDRVSIGTLPCISLDESTNVTAGFENYMAGCFMNDITWTYSTSRAYFSDVNGDGLVDLVNDNEVFFNRLDGDVPTFETTSEDTEFPIIPGIIDGNLLDNMAAVVEERESKSPLMDAIKSWEAPFDGDIHITGDIIYSTPAESEYKYADGLKVTIEYNEVSQFSHTFNSAPDASDQIIPVNIDSLHVTKGTCVYFRVQSVYDGAFDKVEWDPYIEYLVDPEDIVNDENGKNPYSYLASEDFTYAGRRCLVFMPLNGVVRVYGEFSKSKILSDNCTIVINKITVDSTEEISERIYEHLVNWNDLNTVTVDESVSVESKNRLEFKIETDSRIDVSAIVWTPFVEYTSVDDPDILVCDNGNPAIVFEAFYDQDVYPESNCIDPGDRINTISEETELTIVPVVKLKTSTPATYDSEIIFTAKRRNELLGKAILEIVDGTVVQCDPYKINVDVYEDDELFFDFNTKDPGLVQYIESATAYTVDDNYIPQVITPTNASWTSARTGLIYVEGLVTAHHFPDFMSHGITIGVVKGATILGETTVEIPYTDTPPELVPFFFTFDAVAGETYSFYFDISPFNTGDLTIEMKCTYETSGDNIVENLNHFIIKSRSIMSARHPNLKAQEYRGWAYFGYNGNNDQDDNRRDRPMDHNRLTIDQHYGENDKTRYVYVFYPCISEGKWKSEDSNCWITTHSISSSRNGEDHFSIPETTGGIGVSGIPRISSGRQTTEGISAGLLSTSLAEGSTMGSLDYMDMNGDQFPDIITSTGIQYTVPTGGLYQKDFSFSGNVREADNSSVSFGGSIPVMAPNGRGLVNRTLKGGVFDSMPISFNIDIGSGSGESISTSDLIDMNGDGLPDLVYRTGGGLGILFNTGYDFTGYEEWSGAEINSGYNEKLPKGVSFGYYTDFYGFGAGLNFGGNFSVVTKNLMDINGDGLPDFLDTSSGGLSVYFNTGCGFSVPVEWTTRNFHINESESQTGSGGIYFTIPIYIVIPIIPPIFFTILINPGGNVSYSYGRQTEGLRDINGDNLPDIVSSSGSSINVHTNRTGRTTLLRQVELPLGGSYTFDYTRDGNTYEQPSSKWVLSSIITYDGHAGDGADFTRTSIAYTDGNYNRYEREFLGYGQITMDLMDKDGILYSRNIKTYYNDHYYRKNLLISEELLSNSCRTISNTEYFYTYYNVTGDIPYNEYDTYFSYYSIFPRLVRKDVWLYEDDPISSIYTYNTFDYDKYGNIIKFYDSGNTNFAGDDIHLTISYLADESRWIVDRPLTIEVRDEDGIIFRKRSGTYDVSGNLLTLTLKNDKRKDSIYNFVYDIYGNITQVTDPNNYVLEYRYDSETASYVTETEDSFGLISYSSYNYLWGTKSSTTDINNNQFTYTYDIYGRMVQVFSPYDTDNPALSFEYYQNERPVRTITYNKIHFDPVNDASIVTVVFSDGLSRTIQTKKSGVVYNDGNFRNGMNINGIMEYDEFGRVVSESQPVFQDEFSGYDLYEYYPEQSVRYPTLTTYDVRGRPITKTLPDESMISTIYSIEDNLNVENIIDPEGKEKRIWKDTHGNITRIDLLNNSQTISTYYEYNILDEIISIKDNKGNITTIFYDNLGHRTKIINPDSGTITYTYDPAGNLVKKLDDNLSTMKKSIEYKYEYNRLITVDFPDKEDYVYSYGPGTGPVGERGKLLSIFGDWGSTHFTYGKLGQIEGIEKQIKRAVIAQGKRIFLFSYLYDYLGRIESITYPDNEIVSYTYNTGGQVSRITGDHDGTGFIYVDSVGYDEFGQRIYHKYGNGIETEYEYDPLRRWLRMISTKNSEKVFQSMEYDFDRVGNVLSIKNICTDREINQVFAYDDLYQITEAQGTYQDMRIPGAMKTNTYTQNFTYDTIGNILNKESINNIYPDVEAGQLLTYRHKYIYDKEHPNRALIIGELRYLFDHNGNLIIERSKIPGETGTGYIGIPEITPAPYIPDDLPDNVHIIPGMPGFNHPQSSNTNAAVYNMYSWDEENRMIGSIVNGISTIYRYNESGDRVLKANSNIESIYADKMYQANVSSDPVLITKHIFLGDTRIISKLSREMQVSDIGFEQHNIYTYHGDHLGSSNWITDFSGDEYEHMEYTPYGESWVTEESDKLDFINYWYTSKELDQETGFYYFGARYLNPRISRWTSCDPAFIDYLPAPPVNDDAKRRNQNLPGMGGVFNVANLALYHYAGNNPVKYVDPNGESLSFNNLKQNFNMTLNSLLLNSNISRNYKLKQFTFSDEAAKNNINNMPSSGDIKQMKILAENILEPLQKVYKKTVNINSGYRSLELNKAIVGSSRTSQHMTGNAVDIEITGVDNIEFANYIKNNLEFDQLILEYHTPGVPDSGWIHVSFVQGKNRGIVMIKEAGCPYRQLSDDENF